MKVYFKYESELFSLACIFVAVLLKKKKKLLKQALSQTIFLLPNPI